MLYCLEESVFRIRFILIWIRITSDPFRGITDPDPRPDPTENLLFFLSKKSFPKKWLVFLLMRKIFMSVKQMFNILQNIYNILVILVDFCGNFQWFGWYYAYPDPFHMKRIRIRNRVAKMKWVQTDPDPKQWKEWSLNKI